jgi:hypothetical protein
LVTVIVYVAVPPGVRRAAIGLDDIERTCAERVAVGTVAGREGIGCRRGVDRDHRDIAGAKATGTVNVS